MPSPDCERAIDDALRAGNVILKFISPNDAGQTESHQCGFYLPKKVWEMFTPHPPDRGRNDKHHVEITWPDGRVTKSDITWYGRRTRSEYRLTRFGRDFPYLTADTVGSLLVLIINDQDHFNAYVLDTEDDAANLQAALGVEPFEHWGVFRNGQPEPEDEDQCIEREFRALAGALNDFPTGEWFSEAARQTLQNCVQNFLQLNPDRSLMKCCETEYLLFKIAERRLCQNEINHLFRNIDEFIRTAGRIMNRRKSRAGRSLENHVHYLLTQAQIEHEMRPRNVDGKPDIVIPNSEAYRDRRYPLNKLFIVGVKTTCKDRWRQVMREGQRVPRKHILTIQQAISAPQLREMHAANVSLIVPRSLQRNYRAPAPMRIFTVEGFIDNVRRQLAR
jgi:hypothetical protein